MNDSNQGAQEHVIRAVQAGGNDKLLGAKEALKERLMRAVMEQAIHELGEPATIARSIMANFGSDVKAVSATSQILKQLLLAEIESTTSANLKDADATAAELFSRVKGQWSEPEAIMDALREKILEDTATRAVQSLGSQEDAAEELMRSGRIPDEHISELSAAISDRISSEASQRSLSSMSNRDAAADAIFASLGADHTVIVETSLALEVMIREEVQRQAENSLGDSARLAQQVYDSLDNADAQVREVARAVADRIVQEIAGNVTETIADSDRLVSDADSLLDGRDQAISSAISDLTNAIVTQIAERTQSDLSDSDAIARRVMDRLSENENVLARFTASAKERVLADVVNNAISELSEDLGTSADGLPEQSPASMGSAPPPRQQEPSQPPPEPAIVDDLESIENDSDSWDSSFDNDDSGGPGWPSPAHDVRGDRPASSGHHSESSPAKRVAASGFKGSSFDDGASQGGGKSSPEYSFTTQEQPAPSRPGFVVEEVSFEPSEDVFTAFRDDDDGSSAVETEVQTQTQTDTAVYVYGIANGSAAGHVWPDEGMDDSYPVRTIAYEGLHAIVSLVRADEYTGDEGEANMKRVDWLKDRARRHAIILESMKLGDTFVPMRFCTVLGSDAAVEELLARDHGHYRSVIDRVKGAEEWSIRVYRDLNQLEHKVRDSDRKVEDSLGVISKGVVNFVKEEMQRIDKMGGEAIELITDHCVRRSHAALVECSRDGLLKPVIADETGGDIILSAAYLVDSGSADRIRDEVDRLASEYEDLGFRYELSGPWPPYHFVSGAQAGGDQPS